ncbi:hypothetical protein AVEN_155289-1 [Araneus ventricosus]|uniref:Uncharacterized protein n=1 Tax=Araneus ventricosus TaxID=182803 RepID=A0A4Y2D7R4_ARAVE|nr:hypothetical protein AVEN_155289-1 [Araneus ventricosus]
MWTYPAVGVSELISLGISLQGFGNDSDDVYLSRCYFSTVGLSYNAGWDRYLAVTAKKRGRSTDINNCLCHFIRYDSFKQTVYDRARWSICS